MFTHVLFSPDVRHGGTVVQGLLGFVNPVAASIKVRFPVWFGSESVSVYGPYDAQMVDRGEWFEMSLEIKPIGLNMC